MAAEVNNMPGGWPLGLEIMNTRLRATGALQVAAMASNSSHLYSDSYSSRSSSELDTESTRSFFRDGSITLGRLIGLNPGDGDLFFANSLFSELEMVPMVSTPSNAMKRREASSSCCICVPIITNVIVKISPGRIIWR